MEGGDDGNPPLSQCYGTCQPVMRVDQIDLSSRNTASYLRAPSQVVHAVLNAVDEHHFEIDVERPQVFDLLLHEASSPRMPF
jgi:hypothetical protein